MKVAVEDEERIRKAGKILQENIKKYREEFGIDDNQDLLAMVAFDCMVEKMKMQETSTDTDDSALDHVARLNQLITDNL